MVYKRIMPRRITKGLRVGATKGGTEMGRTLDTEGAGLYSPGVHFLWMVEVKRPIPKHLYLVRGLQ